MPNMAVIVGGFTGVGAGVDVNFFVQTDTGVITGGEITVDFQASAVQTNQAIISAAVAAAEALGVVFQPTDVKMLFGGRATN